jgi:hypothetical protein
MRWGQHMHPSVVGMNRTNLVKRSTLVSTALSPRFVGGRSARSKEMHSNLWLFLLGTSSMTFHLLSMVMMLCLQVQSVFRTVQTHPLIHNCTNTPPSSSHDSGPGPLLCDGNGRFNEQGAQADAITGTSPLHPSPHQLTDPGPVAQARGNTS